MAKTFKVREVIRILESNGFEMVRHEATGHRTFRRIRKGETLQTIVSGNANDDMPAGTLAAIRRQTGLRKELR